MVNSITKPIIGILGGIGSGKSTVAAEFAKLGCAVIDADKIAHQVLSEKSVKAEIAKIFGKAVFDSDGNINRKKLGEAAFSSHEMNTQLNDITHPVVLQRAERLIERYKTQQNVKAIVLDMPLLFEVGWEKRCDKLIFVRCDREKRLERAKKNELFNENQLRIRENFQISLDKKASIAENVINNNSGYSAIAGQVADILSCVVDKG
ncbi:MAG: dephospho-CoA kinase [Planctomycetota bacterium]